MVAFSKHAQVVKLCQSWLNPAPEKSKFIAKNSPSFEFVGEYKRLAPDDKGFSQELIYGGRAGDILKFTYREFRGGYIRNPFTQQIQYDLTEGNMVGFKEARIEVLEASNTRIKYRVLRHFEGF